ncbi:MAG: hypothetical protein JJU05_16145 [Verrucomicrobia bacterium]|nr:hypothetical protein [Verrucomicrobiota bacterium]
MNREIMKRATANIWIPLGVLIILCNGCVYISSTQVGKSAYPPEREWDAVESGKSAIHIIALLQGDKNSYGIPWIFLFERDQLPYQLNLVFAVPEDQPADKVVITYLEVAHEGRLGGSYSILEDGYEKIAKFGFDDMSQWNAPSMYRSRVSFPASIRSRSNFELTIQGYIKFSEVNEKFSQFLRVDSKEEWYLTPSLFEQLLRDASW